MKFIAGLAVSAALIGALSTATAALAAPDAGKTAKAPATLKCPKCGMPMPSTKSAAFPVPVKVNGHVYYCCSKCPAGQAAQKKTAPAKPAAKAAAGSK